MLRATVFMFAMLAAGCGASAASGGSGSASGSAGAAAIWANECMRCHNMRSPSSLSDAQWAASMQHMRIRANLTAAESKAVLEFLQSGN